MELKEYQKTVLERFEQFLAKLDEKHEEAQDFVEFQKGKGKEASLGDWCREAWDSLNAERILPVMRNSAGETVVAPWLGRSDGVARAIPSVCLKVPTGGGKTLLATECVHRLQNDYFKKQTGFVLWVVPSDAIYKQTWKSLANREHPYRQKLERASGGRVKVLEKGDAFTKADVESNLCVMLLMLQSSARKSKDTLRMFRDSGKFSDFFPEEDDPLANKKLAEKIPNLDVNDLAEIGWDAGLSPNSVSIKQSLGNTLRLVRPIIIIDEGHKAYTETARSTLTGFNPRFMLELSATPNASGTHASNVLVSVSGTSLKDEEMIKLPINVSNTDKAGWKHTLATAHAKLAELEKEAEDFQRASGRYIRPIMLIRADRTGREQRDTNHVHAEDAREYLQDKLGVRPEEIRLKTSETDELGKEELLDELSVVRYIITKDALREGWDCPFAYILTILSKTTANTALTQMIGRVLRQPHARLTGRAALDESYVFTFDQDVREAVEYVRKGLQEEGMGDVASNVRVADGAGKMSGGSTRKTIGRRKGFENLKVFLPRVLAKHDESPEGYRQLDYERDILGKLDWDAFSFLTAGEFSPEDSETLSRTIVRINVADKEKDEESELDFRHEESDLSEEDGLDFPFLVRQLTEIIPNAWQAARILEDALEVIRRQPEMNEAKLFTNRLTLLAEMKLSLKKQVDEAAETLFHSQLKSGEISFRLASSQDARLNWELAETLEIAISDEDHELSKKSGADLEKNLFAPVYRSELNNLEREVAWYLDDRKAVHWWHRIAVSQNSYGLQGWQKNRVYPDFLACLNVTEEKKCRFTLLETKGDHLRGNLDTEYKRKLFDLLTRQDFQPLEGGELKLDLESESITFEMVFGEEWRKDMDKVF